jgi:hypothetical protein
VGLCLWPSDLFNWSVRVKLFPVATPSIYLSQSKALLIPVTSHLSHHSQVQVHAHLRLNTCNSLYTSISPLTPYLPLPIQQNDFSLFIGGTGI